MSTTMVEVLELISWDLDQYPYRTLATGDEATFAGKVEHAHRRLAIREPYATSPTLLEPETQRIQHLFDLYSHRENLEDEYRNLRPRLAVVDLLNLLAFQRRLVFDTARPVKPLPDQRDWPGLIALTIGGRRSTQHRCEQTRVTAEAIDITLYSNNPDLQVRVKRELPCAESLPLILHGGCPFLEVAELRGRWFLRDGYHRAYRLLQAGVHCVPAVVLHAQTIEELGATEPWFFNEQQLFSDRPPRVLDFLDDEMSLRYRRKALRKIIRIRIEESLEELDEMEREEL